MPAPVPDPSLLAGIDWGYVLSGVLGLIMAGQKLRKTLSKDKVEMRSDGAQITLIEKIQQERDQLAAALDESRRREDNAWIARNEDAKLIGRMSVQVDHLHELNQSLSGQVASLRKDIHTLRNALATFQGAAMLKLLKDGYDPNDPDMKRIIEAVQNPIPDLVCDLSATGGCPAPAPQGGMQ